MFDALISLLVAHFPIFDSHFPLFTCLPNLSDIFCPNCGLSGHHIDFPLLCTTSTSNNGESAKKKARSHQQQQNSGPSLCMEPKYDAYMKYPQRKNACCSSSPSLFLFL